MKKGVYVRVRDDGTWEEFKSYVLSKHGKIHGALGEELLEALREYLHKQKYEGSSPSKSESHKGRIASELPRLKEAIMEEVGEKEVPRKVIENIIMRVCGVVDEKAVKRRIRALIVDNFLMSSFDKKKFLVVSYEKERGKTTKAGGLRRERKGVQMPTMR